MDYAAYFESENIELLRDTLVFSTDQLGGKISYLAETKKNIKDYDIALVGVPDLNESTNSGLKDAPDIIRKFLYNLYVPGKISVIDMGNLINTGSVNDTYSALRDVLSELALKKIKPIIMGGGLHLNYAAYQALAFEKLECSISVVSPRVNYTCKKNKQNPDQFINKIIAEKGHCLYNYSNIGYQEYYNNDLDITEINDLFYDAVRLGQARSSLVEVEPYLRNSNIIGFDISSVRCADAPGFHNANPNGFYGEEICQLARYAGLSDENRIFGVYNVNPDFDINSITSHLAAQVIWYYIKGYYQMKLNKDGEDNSKNILKFNVHVDDGDQTIIFYKNKLTEKWWMEIPGKNTQAGRLTACTSADYMTACSGELPDRWWRAYQKSN